MLQVNWDFGKEFLFILQIGLVLARLYFSDKMFQMNRFYLITKFLIKCRTIYYFRFFDFGNTCKNHFLPYYPPHRTLTSWADYLWQPTVLYNFVDWTQSQSFPICVSQWHDNNLIDSVSVTSPRISRQIYVHIGPKPKRNWPDGQMRRRGKQSNIYLPIHMYANTLCAQIDTQHTWPISQM